MVCPECSAEYREEVQECSDCQTALVPELPPEPQPELQPEPKPELELVTVLATGNPARIAVAKSLLEDSAIEYLTKDEAFHDLFPVSRFRIQIQVRSEDKEEAGELLADLLEE